MYVKNGITSWIFGWMKNGWRNSQNKAVENADFWKDLYSLSRNFEIEWKWTKAHSSDVLNNEVDKLARDAATSFSNL
jgi:ribonuclease HI